METIMGTIYKLEFANGDFYIGQTANPVDERIYYHKHNKGKGCPKLQKAFETSEFLGYKVLAELPPEELDDAEIKFISELNPPLNTLPGGKVLRGLNHPKVKYLEWQINEVVRLFIETDAKYSDITNITGVQSSTVHDILKRRSHAWATDNIDPKVMQAAADRRARPDSVVLYDIDNNRFEADTLKELAEAMHISYQTVRNAIIGVKSRLGLSKEPHKLVELTDPEGEAFVLTYPRAEEFLYSFDLSRFSVEQLLIKGRKSKGWAAKILEN